MSRRFYCRPGKSSLVFKNRVKVRKSRIMVKNTIFGSNLHRKWAWGETGNFDQKMKIGKNVPQGVNEVHKSD